MQRFAQELGVSFKFDAMLTPRVDCSHAPLGVRLTPAEIVQLDLDYPERGEEWRRFAGRFCVPPAHSDEIYQCGGGSTGFAIDPEGKLSLCTTSQAEVFDLRSGSFLEGWNQFLRRVRRTKITRVTKCTACQIKSMCGMCPANAELENGDPESPVEFLCEVAHGRAKALNIPVPPHGGCAFCGGKQTAPLFRVIYQGAPESGPAPWGGEYV
jgi:radical SAM protein with 4Fe4S-binding SPASM domain